MACYDHPPFTCPIPPHPTTSDADKIRAAAKVAYEWGWPLVNVDIRAQRMERLLRRHNKEHMRVDGWPIGYNSFTMQRKRTSEDERLMCCPNTSLRYGGGAFRLGTEGAIAQVPPELCTNGFWLYALYDARTQQFGQLGKQYVSDEGFYLIVGPDWDGYIPPGVHASEIKRCTTDLAYLTARIFVDPALPPPPWVQKVLFYPRSKYQSGVYQGVDWQDPRVVKEIQLPITLPEELRYVNWKHFFSRDFPKVLAEVEQQHGEEEFYRCFNRLLELAADKRWVRAICLSAARDTENTTIKNDMLWSNNGEWAGNEWYTSVHSAEWLPNEYPCRTATAKSNLFQNRAEDTRYYCTDNDSNGYPLNGRNTYKIRFEGDLPPATGPASVTVYSQNHFLCEDPYSASIKTGDVGHDTDGTPVIHAGPENSSDIRTPRNEPFCLYLRAYGMDESGLPGPWQPPLVERQ